VQLSLVGRSPAEDRVSRTFAGKEKTCIAVVLGEWWKRWVQGLQPIRRSVQHLRPVDLERIIIKHAYYWEGNTASPLVFFRSTTLKLKPSALFVTNAIVILINRRFWIRHVVSILFGVCTIVELLGIRARV
jgi:hypothetical protein